jgi:hypothetical protein
LEDAYRQLSNCDMMRKYRDALGTVDEIDSTSR